MGKPFFLRSLADLPPPPRGRNGWPWTVGEGSGAGSVEQHSCPLITVVTPSFNQGCFIEETIRSVLLQDYPAIEYFVIDGGSTDETLSIIEKYRPWLDFVVSEPDGGQAAAINKGWRRSRGEAVTWLNSDDTLAPRGLALAAEALFDENGPDLVYGNINEIDRDSQLIRRSDSQEFDAAKLVVCSQNPVAQQGFLMRRSVLDRVGYLDESLHFAMDFDLWVRIALAGLKVHRVDAVLAGFRSHDTSKSSSLHRTRIADRVKIYDRVFSDSNLPPEFRHLADSAFDFWHQQAAYIAFRAGDSRLARHHASLGRNFSFTRISILLASFLGDSGMRRIRSLFRKLRGTL